MENFDNRFEYLEAHIPDTLLKTVCKNIEENNNEINDENIAALYRVFGNILHKAFEMIEKERFELVKIANTKRSYVVVHGSTGIYTLYTNVNFCQCYSYKINISKRRNFICKHILGSRLALSMKKYKERRSEDFIYHNMSDSNAL